MPSPIQNSHPSSYHHPRPPGRGKLLISPKHHFFENLFPIIAERGGGNYDLLYQNSVRKEEDDLEHYLYFV